MSNIQVGIEVLHYTSPNELPLCPRCGERARIVPLDSRYFAECSECLYPNTVTPSSTQEEAVEAWKKVAQ